MTMITMAGFVTTPTRFGQFPVNANRIGDRYIGYICYICNNVKLSLEAYTFIIHVGMQHDACIDDVACRFVKEQSWKQFAWSMLVVVCKGQISCTELSMNISATPEGAIGQILTNPPLKTKLYIFQSGLFIYIYIVYRNLISLHREIFICLEFSVCFMVILKQRPPRVVEGFVVSFPRQQRQGEQLLFGVESSSLYNTKAWQTWPTRSCMNWLIHHWWLASHFFWYMCSHHCFGENLIWSFLRHVCLKRVEAIILIQFIFVLAVLALLMEESRKPVGIDKAPQMILRKSYQQDYTAGPKTSYKWSEITPIGRVK